MTFPDFTRHFFSSLADSVDARLFQVQRMMPLEQEVFSHAHEALERVRKRKGGARSLRKYYEWVDEFVKKNYPSVIQTQDDATTN